MEGFVDIKVDRWFEIIENRIEMWQKVAGIMHESVEKNFDAGGRPKWTPMVSGLPKSLTRSGRLRTSFMETATEESAELSTDVPYAPYQQFGAKIPITDRSRAYFWHKWYETQDPQWRWMALTKKKTFTLPASPFFMFQNEDKEKIADEIFRGLVKFIEPISTKGSGNVG